MVDRTTDCFDDRILYVQKYYFMTFEGKEKFKIFSHSSLKAPSLGERGWGWASSTRITKVDDSSIKLFLQYLSAIGGFYWNS
ncbi:MAG: hypothetical protein U5J96_08625 [Ignavibacteriaceae bacterium]|nr:hypothetical protein [Ignavibacteriaceae bacterium]